MNISFNWKQFLIVTLITSLWVQGSEIFRYFVLVIPRVKYFWNDLDTVVQINIPIFLIWAVWGTLLTGMVVYFFWLYSRIYGNNRKSIWISGILSWAFFFVLFWIGAANMGYSDWSILWITLPLSLFELLVASWIASFLFKRYAHQKA